MILNKIPVVIVDDQDADRYIAKRRLAKTGDFDPVFESTTGPDFLETFFNGHKGSGIEHSPLVVLMDINMPQMSGFETIEEVMRRMESGRGPDSVDFMMFTSSENPSDLARADGLDAVKGYIVKPLDEAGIEKIRALYAA